jgi:hypothetical protein
MTTIGTHKEIITYSYAFIRELANSIHGALLDEETINSLKEIKQINKFIRRRSPVKLKYNLNMEAVEAWRKEKQDETLLTPEEKFIQALNSSLNKLSDKNFNKIEKEIGVELQAHKPYNMRKFCRLFVDTLFEKACEEELYTKLYGKLVAIYHNKYPEDFENYVLEQCQEFLSKNLNSNSEPLTSIKDYDRLCEISKEKSKFIGAFIFIASLYDEGMVSTSLIIEYFNILISFIKTTSIDYIEKYIDAIVQFTQAVWQLLRKDIAEQSNKIVIEPLTELSENKTLLKPKMRFKLEELLTELTKEEEEDELAFASSFVRV